MEAVPLVPPYPSAVPGAWSLEVQVYRGYWLVDWFKRQFGAPEVAQAESLGIEPEALFDDLVRATEPGSMGLVIQPTWTPGVRVPGPEAKGAMIGFGDVHTRAHVYRAILEGLAYALREGGERRGGAGEDAAPRAADLRRRGTVAGRRPADGRHLRAADGPAPHPRDVRARRGDRRGRRAGIHPSVPAAVGEMTRLAETIDPDPARHRLYEDLYRRVYRRMYDRLKPLYEEIMEITGYPPR